MSKYPGPGLPQKYFFRKHASVKQGWEHIKMNKKWTHKNVFGDAKFMSGGFPGPRQQEPEQQQQSDLQLCEGGRGGGGG
jgi:hypothetical protein